MHPSAGSRYLSIHPYFPKESRGVYRSKDNRQENIFDALDRLVRHDLPYPQSREIPPSAGVWYYGYYNNLSRGLRQKEDQDALIPCVLEPVESLQVERPDENEKTSSAQFHLALLIQKIYEVDPLNCPQCQGIMRIISIIEDQEEINKILGHVGFWQTNHRPPPKPKALELQIVYSDSQLPFYQEFFDQNFGASADHSTVPWHSALFSLLILSFSCFILFPSKRKFLSNQTNQITEEGFYETIL